MLQVVPREEAVVEPTCLDWVFRRYSSYVATIAMRLLGRNADVDDVVQEVFLQAVKGLEGLRDPEALRGWLATVTVRVARRRLRVRRLRGFLGLDDAPSYDQVASPNASPEQRALLARIYRALDEMPADLRLAWSLRHIEGEQIEAVANLCGCSLATAKRRISEAQDRLSREVNR